MPRGDRDGSIYVDKSGALRVRVRYTDQQGRTREKKRAAGNRAHAAVVKRRLYWEIENELAGQQPLPERKPDVINRGHDERRDEALQQVRSGKEAV